MAAVTIEKKQDPIQAAPKATTPPPRWRSAAAEAVKRFHTALLRALSALSA